MGGDIQQGGRNIGTMEVRNNGEHHKMVPNAGYSLESHLTQHSIIPVFQHSQGTHLILLDFES